MNIFCLKLISVLLITKWWKIASECAYQQTQSSTSEKANVLPGLVSSMQDAVCIYTRATVSAHSIHLTVIPILWIEFLYYFLVLSYSTKCWSFFTCIAMEVFINLTPGQLLLCKSCFIFNINKQNINLSLMEIF